MTSEKDWRERQRKVAAHRLQVMTAAFPNEATETGIVGAGEIHPF